MLKNLQLLQEAKSKAKEIEQQGPINGKDKGKSTAGGKKKEKIKIPKSPFLDCVARLQQLFAVQQTRLLRLEYEVIFNYIFVLHNNFA